MTIDPNVVAASAAAELSKHFFAELKKSSLDFLSKKYSYLFEDFSNYLDITYNKCNIVRTIINKDKSFEIEDIYVPGVFRLGEQKHSDNDLIQVIRDGDPVIVLGFGGIGKTVFTKHLWLSIFKEPHGKIPVYLEIRRLNSITDADLKTYIKRTISPQKKGISQNLFEDFLGDGRFVFIFDGFDELSEQKKESIGEQILHISYEYPKNGFVVSSRHDDRFSSWQRFKIFKACPFDKKQAVELISKIPYDKDTKKKFITDIVEKKHSSYEAFLSTPLLTLMMLMTFSQFAEVPDKKHIFYRYAFMTLYSWHDSSKESFNREKQTGLILDQFEKVFSIFCLISYLGRDFEFDDITIISYVEKVKKYVEFDYDSSLFLREMAETVNLIYREGDKYLFTHRSFQEYFASYAIVSFFHHKIVEIVPRVFRGGDLVLELMYEINRVVVDENYILPKYVEYENDINEIVALSSFERIAEAVNLSYMCGFVRIEDRLTLNMFGTNIARPSWEYVNQLRGFFEAHSGLRPSSELPSFNGNLIDELNKMAKKHIGDHPGERFFAVYYPVKQVFYYGLTEDYVWDDIDGNISRVVSSGKKASSKSAKILSEAKVDCFSIKKLYEFVNKIVAETKIISSRKEKSIDELLS